MRDAPRSSADRPLSVRDRNRRAGDRICLKERACSTTKQRALPLFAGSSCVRVADADVSAAGIGACVVGL
jgi:hypothetical protein